MVATVARVLAPVLGGRALGGLRGRRWREHAGSARSALAVLDAEPERVGARGGRERLPAARAAGLRRRRRRRLRPGHDQRGQRRRNFLADRQRHGWRRARSAGRRRHLPVAAVRRGARDARTGWRCSTGRSRAPSCRCSRQPRCATAGAQKVVLGGASYGGALALSEAHKVRPPLAGVLSFGGEITLPGSRRPARHQEVARAAAPDQQRAGPLLRQPERAAAAPPAPRTRRPSSCCRDRRTAWSCSTPRSRLRSAAAVDRYLARVLS